MENKKTNICILTQELLPVYQDNCVSADSKKIIEEHLQNCELCHEKLTELKTESRSVKNADIAKNLSVNEITEKQNFTKLSQRLKKRKIRNAIIVVAAICILFFGYQISFLYCIFDGMAMYPTIKNGETCIISRFSYAFTDPKIDDIILLKFKEDYMEEEFLKIYRIAGTPGDYIEIKDGHFYVNGIVNERYNGIAPASFDSADSESNTGFSMTVPENQYFILGDNFEVSYDSRYDKVGCIDKSDIYGKCIKHLSISNPLTQTNTTTATTSSDK